jgi:hypothetical protein
VRPKVAHVPASSGGGGNGLLLVSLVLNVVLLLLVALVTIKVMGFDKRLIGVQNEVKIATEQARTKFGVYEERGGRERAVMLVLPKNLDDFPTGTKVIKTFVDVIEKKSKDE